MREYVVDDAIVDGGHGHADGVLTGGVVAKIVFASVDTFDAIEWVRSVEKLDALDNKPFVAPSKRKHLTNQTFHVKVARNARPLVHVFAFLFFGRWLL